MDTKWAAEHLQTIRTLMERSALYRRALAPVSTFVGAVGTVAGFAGWALNIEADGAFAVYWMAVAIVAIVGSLWLVRRQAMKDGECFWSPPLRRVVQAMLPPLLIGMFLGVVYAVNRLEYGASTVLVLFWLLLFGLALHAAGFFMPQGIRLLGWVFIIAGLLTLAGIFSDGAIPLEYVSTHLYMGAVFGGLHLAFGIYLYFTERKNEA